MSFHGSSSRGAPDFDPKVSGVCVSFPHLEGQVWIDHLAGRRGKRPGEAASIYGLMADPPDHVVFATEPAQEIPARLRAQALSYFLHFLPKSKCLQHGCCPGDVAGMESHLMSSSSRRTGPF